MMRRARLLFAFLLASACTMEDADNIDDFGIDEELSPVGPMGKEDGAGRQGPLVATNTSATQVWTARNKWEDRDTPAARKAGLAWGENSGLNWDEKFSRWVASLEQIDSLDGYKTVMLTTPWGKTVPAPLLECAEAAIFLRASFAAWYELPFFLESVSSSGKRVYFGHFGIRSGGVKYASTPSFATAYKDYSSWTAADLATKGWPKDEKLRARSASGGSDAQPQIGAAHFGAYLDEVHLNKRAGHLIIYLLNYFGSVNLADSANTYNLVPEAIRPGDVLLHRWQRSGIGDTKLLWQVGANAAGATTVQLMSGSIPRRQPKIYDEVSSKGYFTQEDTGGRGQNFAGDWYWKLGGGVKRWRVTKNVGGYWTNTWMAADEASWINDQDEERIASRPEQFQALLGEVSPAEKRDALLRQIEDSRAHLLKYPASCAARERRERAFAGLYELAPRLGATRESVDRDHRRLEDYVFAELSYGQSRTCCWNSTTAAMADVILDYAEQEQADACVVPAVFRSETTGYARWRDYAAATGRASAWREWSEDEGCPQRDVAADTEAAHEWTAWCELDAAPEACTDGYEPNDSRAAASPAAAGATRQGQICAGDHDYFAVTVASAGTVSATLTFVHSTGDLDLELLGPDGARVAISEGTTNTETVSAMVGAGTYTVHVYGYAGATGAYSLAL